MMLVALANFPNNSLDEIGELIRRDDVVLGLGDGGAHVGTICDASYPPFALAHWARDRAPRRRSVAEGWGPRPIGPIGGPGRRPADEEAGEGGKAGPTRWWGGC